MGDDSSCSSDDSDDIGKRIAAAGKNRALLMKQHAASEIDDDDSVEGVQLYAGNSQRNSRRNAAVARNQAMRIQKLMQENADSDEDNFEGKKGGANKTAAIPQKRVYEIDSSSDEDDSYTPVNKRTSLLDLAKEGKINMETAKQLNRAKLMLQTTKEITIDDDDDDEEEAAAWRNLTIHMQGYPSVELRLPETDTAQHVLNRTREKLNLPPNTSIGCLRYNDRIIPDNHLLMELPSTCELSATILQGQVTTNNEKKKKPAIGPLLRLKVRCGGTTHAVQLGEQQPLRVLGFSQLRFDGDDLDLDALPKVYELEEDDLLEGVAA